MNDPSTQVSAPPKKKPLDTVVKLALAVFFGSFALIWGGMYLSRPDRSIPPYSIGSQEGESPLEAEVLGAVVLVLMAPALVPHVARWRALGRTVRGGYDDAVKYMRH